MSYLVESGNYEVIYNNMRTFRLAQATEHARAVGCLETAVPSPPEPPA